MASVNTTITELPESRVRVEAQVPAAEVERRVQQAAVALGRQMRIPGFRKGKVPPPVVIRRLGRKAVLDEALRGALEGWYVDAIDGAGIATIGEPELDVGRLPPQGEPLSFSIEVGVRPKAKLGEYRGLEVGRREAHVEDSAVDAELASLRDRFATLETVGRPAQAGDHVVIDYLGVDPADGVPFAGGEGRDQLLELGSGRLIPGFEAQLTGAGAGDERKVEVTFPEDYAGELAGRQATFQVTVKEVKAKRLPELDDDFASDASDFGTLPELREDIARRMREVDERAVEKEFESAVLEAVVAGARIDVPEKLVHSRAHELLDETLSAMERQGINRETYLRIVDRDEEALAHEAEPEAAAALRRQAVLAAIVEAEGISPTDEQLSESLQAAAQNSGTTVGELMEQLRSRGRLERIRQDLATDQALELVVGAAQAIDVEQAKARERLWTPGKSEEPASTDIWTPGS